MLLTSGGLALDPIDAHPVGHGPPSLPPRPQPRGGLTQRASEWLEWFGVGRLVATAVAVVAVGGGGYWLLRTPPAPPEASLPRATTTSTATVTSTSLPHAAATTPDVALVHVAGAVVRPGVYELPGGARVADAIAAAGGPAPDGDPDLVNLAAVVADGQRLYVPRIGEPVAALPPPASSDMAAPAGPVDVNSAEAAQLEALPGIGPATAAAIVRHREQNGPFASVDALLDVPGIGPAKLDAFRALVAV